MNTLQVYNVVLLSFHDPDLDADCELSIRESGAHGRRLATIQTIEHDWKEFSEEERTQAVAFASEMIKDSDIVVMINDRGFLLSLQSYAPDLLSIIKQFHSPRLCITLSSIRKHEYTAVFPSCEYVVPLATDFVSRTVRDYLATRLEEQEGYRELVCAEGVSSIFYNSPQFLDNLQN